jgi:nitronate monooxygenase
LEKFMNAIFDRVDAFCARFGLQMPILLAPMAGACPPSLSIAIANAGGLGSCGVLLMKPDEIIAWAHEVRGQSNGAFQLNNWIPDPDPERDHVHEAQVREFLAGWGPPVPPEAGGYEAVGFRRAV